MKWYVKGADGKVFGPADDEKILSWVKDGRVDPFAGVSNDLKTWKLASLEPSFEMDWIVENDPGRFYGPMHRAVIDDLMKSGAIPQTCRIYRDYHGGMLENEIASVRSDAEKAMSEVQADAERMMAELKAESERVIGGKDGEIAELKSALERMKSEAERSEALIHELKREVAAFTETKKREWRVDTVVEPEIVSEAPPASVQEVFRSGKPQILADLEHQAQAELARMGASAAKKFFGIRK